MYDRLYDFVGRQWYLQELLVVWSYAQSDNTLQIVVFGELGKV